MPAWHEFIGPPVLRRWVKIACIESATGIARELYLSFLLDRATSWVTVMASTEGGMDIEQVAAETPEKIIKVAIDPAVGLQPFHARKIAFGLGLEGGQVRQAVKFLQGMYNAYMELDASLVEINPLVETTDGEVLNQAFDMQPVSVGLFLPIALANVARSGVTPKCCCAPPMWCSKTAAGWCWCCAKPRFPRSICTTC